MNGAFSIFTQLSHANEVCISCLQSKRFKREAYFKFAKRTFPCVRAPARTLYTLSVKRKGKERGGVQGIDGGFLGLLAEDLFNGVRVIGELGLVAVEKEVARLVAVL